MFSLCLLVHTRERVILSPSHDTSSHSLAPRVNPASTGNPLFTTGVPPTKTGTSAPPPKQVMLGHVTPSWYASCAFPQKDCLVHACDFLSYFPNAAQCVSQLFSWYYIKNIVFRLSHVIVNVMPSKCGYGKFMKPFLGVNVDVEIFSDVNNDV